MPYAPKSHSQRECEKRDSTFRKHEHEMRIKKDYERLRDLKAWKKTRLRKLFAFPLCEDPYGTHEATGREVIATQVHHIVKLGDRPDLAYNMDNLMSLCVDCHMRIDKGVKSENN